MRYTHMRCAPMRYTPMRCTSMRYTPMRYTPMRCTSMRYTLSGVYAQQDIHTQKVHALGIDPVRCISCEIYSP
jgi:hypothetical protein